jgi:hypothetical protein
LLPSGQVIFQDGKLAFLPDDPVIQAAAERFDVSAELLALDIVEERARNGEFSAEVARKIVEDNPGRFYGI